MSNIDPTSLNATQRDVLTAIGAALNGRDQAPRMKEVKRLAVELTDRVGGEHTGQFSMAVDALQNQGLVQKSPDPNDARQKVVGLTLDGEQALSTLAERSAEATDQEVTP